MDIEWFTAECILVSGFFALLLTKGVRGLTASFYQQAAAILYCFAFCSLGYTYSLYDMPVIFDGLLLVDLLGLAAKACVLVLSLAVLGFMSSDIKQFSLPPLETYFLFAIHTVGMLVSISAMNWMSLFIGFELMYLPLYAMIGLLVYNRTAQESACKYILLGAFSSGLMLYGISLIYACTGDLSFDSWLLLASDLAAGKSGAYAIVEAVPFALLGSSLVLVALCFKLGVVPFHFWVRDVYEGSVYSVTALIAGAPKLVLLVVWYRIFTDMGEDFMPVLAYLISAVGLLSLYIGHFWALSQERIKTLFAYSSFGHMGFVLLALAYYHTDVYVSAVCYTMIYALTISGLFLGLSCITVNGRSVVLLEDLRGLAQRDAKIACCVAVTCFSLLGLPPFAGFMMKVGLLRALIMRNAVMLAVATIPPMMVSAYYYIAVVASMYFYLPDEKSVVVINKSWAQMCCLGLIMVVIILIGIFPNMLWQLMALVL